jgi:photosystem II stability/assembly factor-like uncharacterized protein
MKAFIIILSITLSTNSLFSQPGWFPQTSGTTNYLYSVYFISDNTGWAVGQASTVLKTTNAGTNWLPQIGGASGFLYSVFFISENTGWACGQSGAIIKTTNGGANWFSQVSGYPADYLYSVCFTDVNFGYICGSNGLILKTINGGNNWTNIPSGTTNTLSCVNFPVSAVSTTGFISGGSAIEGTILKTQNQGTNWALQTVGNNWLFGIYFINVNTGWSVGYNNTIYRSTNGGTSWIIQTAPVAQRFLSVHFIDENTGWACGYNGWVIHTINGGVTWLAQQTGTTENLWGIFFRNALTGWAVGWNGKIIHTTNGGVFTSVQQIGNSVPERFQLYQNYPNPFNPVTKIKFDIGPPLNPLLLKEGTARSAGVVLKIHDILGKEVTTLVNEQLSPGTFEVEWNASGFPSGVYFFRLTADGHSLTKKIVLLK